MGILGWPKGSGIWVETWRRVGKSWPHTFLIGRWSSGLSLNTPSNGKLTALDGSSFYFWTTLIAGKVLFCLMTVKQSISLVAHTGLQLWGSLLTILIMHSFYRWAKSSRNRSRSCPRSQENEWQCLGRLPGPLTPCEMFFEVKHSDTLALFRHGL